MEGAYPNYNGQEENIYEHWFSFNSSYFYHNFLLNIGAICGIIYLVITESEVQFMTLAEKLIGEFEQLTEEKQREVINFIEFIKVKEQKEIENLMDTVITENNEALRELAK